LKGSTIGKRCIMTVSQMSLENLNIRKAPKFDYSVMCKRYSIRREKNYNVNSRRMIDVGNLASKLKHHSLRNSFGISANAAPPTPRSPSCTTDAAVCL